MCKSASKIPVCETLYHVHMFKIISAFGVVICMWFKLEHKLIFIVCERFHVIYGTLNAAVFNKSFPWQIGTASHTTATVYPKKYAHGFVVLCFVVVMQSFIMNSHEVFIHIHQGCFAGTGAIVRLPQCQWSKPGGYGKISQCITTTKHSKAKIACIFLGIYCIVHPPSMI